MFPTPVPCERGEYLDQVNGCTQCGEGTYSAGGTISLCSNCPAGKTVASGHGSSESDCSWSKFGYLINMHQPSSFINPIYSIQSI